MKSAATDIVIFAEPGIYYDIPFEDCPAIPAIGQSGQKKIMVSL